MIAQGQHGPTALMPTVTQALQNLRQRHPIDPVVLVQQVGGTALGFMLATAYADRCGDVTMPVWTLASPTEVHSAQFADYVAGVCAPGSGGLLVKNSSCDESFTEQARRGANSSHKTQFRQVDPGTPALVLAAARRASPSTRAVILQDIVPLPSASAVYFHAYTYGATAVVECATRGGGRVLFAGDGEHELYVENVGTEPLVAHHRHLLVQHALSFAQFASACLTGPPVPRWNIEGCWDGDQEQLYLFQSRPSPADRPHDNPPQAGPEPGQHLWSTHFVWGAFDLITTVGDMVVRHEQDVHAGPVAALMTGALAISTRTAFRLSHEPFFLPPVAQRDGYRYAYVPQDVLAQIGARKVRCFSDGECCVVDLA